jgi:hypothetical protein
MEYAYFGESAGGTGPALGERLEPEGGSMTEARSANSTRPTGRASHRPIVHLLLAAAVGATCAVSAAIDARAQQPPPSAAPVPPPAAPDTSYVVVTNDGSQYRGELVERVTGSHLTLKLATGEVRRIPLADVKAEWRAGQPPPSAATALAATQGLVLNQLALLQGATTGVPLAYHGPDEVAIHLTNADAASTRGALYHESASGWEQVCQLPCTTTVDPKGSYKLHNTDPFQFPRSAGTLDMVADIGSRRKNAGWAWALIGLGIAGVSTGPFLLVNWDPMTADGKPKPLDPGLKTAGWSIIGGSAAAIIAGVVLLVAGPSTTLTTTTGTRIAREPSIPLPGHLALTPSGLAF